MSTVDWVALNPMGNHLDSAPKVSLAEVTFTDHALERANERGFTAEQIRDLIESPERAWISREHEAWMFARGVRTVALRRHRDNPNRWAAITVIDHGSFLDEQYAHALSALGWEAGQ